MKCNGCSAEISPTAKYCPKCGKSQQITAAMINAAKYGDQDAIADLYNRTYNSVYQTAKMLIRDEDTVLDVVQDSYIKAFQSLEQLDSPESFQAWIKRIATNKAKDYLKKKKPVLFTELSNDEDMSPEYTFQDDRTENLPDQVIDQQETTRLIDEILNTLSDEQRLVIGMFYYEQMSVKEIAESVGCSENTVKSRLNYGRKKIEAKVLELEKQGTKLYSLAPLPFLLWLFKGMAKRAVTVPSEAVLHAVQKECTTLAASAVQTGIGEAVAQKLTEKTVETVTKEAVKSAAAETVAKATAGTAVKAAAGAATKAVATKVTASILAVALIGGGATTAVVVHNKNEQPTPPSIVESVEESVAETQEQVFPTSEVQIPESPPSTPSPSVAPTPTNTLEDLFEVYAPNSKIRVLDENGDPYMNGYVLGYTYLMTETSSGGGAGEYQVQAGDTFELPAIGSDGATVELALLFDFDKEKTLTKYVRFEEGAAENEIIFMMPEDGVFPEPQELPLPTKGSGQCGDNVYWTYDTGILTLTGTGETWYMVGGEGGVPWSTVCRVITDIVIGEGITYLSPYIFSGYPHLENVFIPSSVNEIAYGAFGKECIKQFQRLDGFKTELARLQDETAPDASFRECKDAFMRGLKLQPTAKERKYLPLIIIVLILGAIAYAEMGDSIYWLVYPVLIVLAVLCTRYQKKKRVEAKIKIAELEQTIAKEEALLNAYVESNLSKLSILPDDYWYPMCTEYLVKVVRAKRASSIPEALAMYDQQLHRWNMEEANVHTHAILLEQQQQLKSITDILVIDALFRR